MADYTEKPKNWRDLPPEKLAELMNRRSEGYLPALLGFTLVSVSKERVLARMEIKKHHLAPNDYLHAASVIALADTVCGYATIVNLPEGAGGFTTIELKTNFLGTARDGVIHLRGHARPHRKAHHGLGRPRLGREIRPEHRPFPLHPDDPAQEGISHCRKQSFRPSII